MAERLEAANGIRGVGSSPKQCFGPFLSNRTDGIRNLEYICDRKLHCALTDAD
jgi:hypothetical protein